MSSSETSSINSERIYRLCIGVVVGPTTQGLLIEGAPRRFTLSGAAARDIVPQVLPLLDGRRSLGEIAQCLGVPESVPRQITDLLHRHGLIEGLAARRAEGDAPEDSALAFHSRMISLADGRFIHAEEIRDRLHTMRAAICGDDEAVAVPLTADLKRLGVACVRTSFAQAAATIPSRAAFDLVIAIESGSDASSFDQLALNSDTRILRVARGEGHYELGPLFLRGATACIGCFRDGYPAQLRAEPNSTTPSDLPRADAGILAALAGAEAAALLSGFGKTRSTRGLKRGDFAHLEEPERYLVVPNPGCPRCGRSGAAEESGPDAVEAFEWSEELLPEEIEEHSHASTAARALYLSLQTKRPTFWTSPQAQLPSLEQTPSRTGAAGDWRLSGDGSLSAELLGYLLPRVAGFRSSPAGGRPRRWAPSGGNLGSVELYVVSDAKLLDLPGSILKYDDLTHSLVSVRADEISVMEFLANTDIGDVPDGALALAYVGARGRLSPKYGTFGHRLAHLDAGCAATQLALLAAHLELDLRFADAWDESLGESLELLSPGEYLTAVAVLTSSQGS